MVASPASDLEQQLKALLVQKAALYKILQGLYKQVDELYNQENELAQTGNIDSNISQSIESVNAEITKNRTNIQSIDSQINTCRSQLNEKRYSEIHRPRADTYKRDLQNIERQHVERQREVLNQELKEELEQNERNRQQEQDNNRNMQEWIQNQEQEVLDKEEQDKRNKYEAALKATKEKDFYDGFVVRGLKRAASPIKNTWNRVSEEVGNFDRRTLTFGQTNRRVQAFDTIIEGQEAELANAKRTTKQLEEEFKTATNVYNKEKYTLSKYVQQQREWELAERKRDAESAANHEKEVEEKIKNIKKERQLDRGLIGKSKGLVGMALSPVTGTRHWVGSKFQNWSKERAEAKEKKREEKKNRTVQQKWDIYKSRAVVAKNLLPDAMKWAKGFAKKRNAELFIVMAALLHMMKFGLNFNVTATFMLDVLFALIVYLFFFDDSDRKSTGIRNLLIILGLEIGLPILIGYNQALVNNKYIQYYLLNRLLTPWWFYYAVIWANSSEKTGWIAKAAKIIIILFWFGVILTIPAIGMSKAPMPYYAQMQQSDLLIDFYEKSWSFYEDAGSMIVRGWKSIGDAWERQINLATGGYYVGRVDANQNQPLGVRIENVKPAAGEFFHDSPVSAYGKLKVMSLDDAIKLNATCYKGEKDKDGNIPEGSLGEIFPKTETWLYEQETLDLDCKFIPKTFERGVHKVTLAADFNFETMAYLKTYFMQKDVMRSLVAQGKDPLSEYGITDKNPIAVYTAGPVMLGMGVNEQLVAVDSTGTTQPRLGITVEANTGWDGKIKKLNQLIVQIPDSMELLTETCNFEFKKLEQTPEACASTHIFYKTVHLRDCLKQSGILIENADSYDEAHDNTAVNNCLHNYCEEENKGFTTYYMDTSKYDKQFSNVEKYVTATCRLKINDSQKLMNGAPLSVHYIRAKARYDYEISKDTSVTIKKLETTNPQQYVPSSEEGKLQYTQTKYLPFINEMLTTFGAHESLTPCLIESMIIVESSCKENAYNEKSSAAGLMQVVPRTAQGIMADILQKPEYTAVASQVGVESFASYDSYNPYHSIMFGTFYFIQRVNAVKEKVSPPNNDEIIKYALAEYNDGMGDVQKACLNNGKYISFDSCYGRLPAETRNYVDKIMALKQKCESGDYSTLIAVEQEVAPEHKIGSIEFYAKFMDSDIDDCVNKNRYPDAEHMHTRVPVEIDRALMDSMLYDDYLLQKTRESQTKFSEVAAVDCIKRNKPDFDEASKLIYENRLRLIIRENDLFIADPIARVDLIYNDMIKLDGFMVKKSYDWQTYPTNPFVKLRFLGCTPGDKKFECKVEYDIITKFIGNTEKMQKDARLSDGREYKYYDAAGLLNIRFDGKYVAYVTDNKIIIQTKSAKTVCSVSWESYTPKADCSSRDNPQALGLVITDILAFEMMPEIEGGSAIVTTYEHITDYVTGTDANKKVRENNAKIQVKYDPMNYKDPCCEKPESCSTFALGTCDKADALGKGCRIVFAGTPDEHEYYNNFRCESTSTTGYDNPPWNSEEHSIPVFDQYDGEPHEILY